MTPLARTFAPSLARGLLAGAALLMLAPACGSGGGGDDGGGPDAGVVDIPDASLPPPITDPQPTPAVYKRGSMRPLFQLTPQTEFGRFEIFGEIMKTTDFQSAQTVNSAEQKVNEIAQQLTQERGGTPLNLFIDEENRTRAAAIPFRGNPTDVKLIEVDGVRKAYVPLGGDFTTPGNEISSVNLDNGVVNRIRVGIRPQRVFAHEPSGLIFVCNSYSNYISIIDASRDEILEVDGVPVEIKTEFYCTDLLAVERNIAVGEVDELFLYVANQWRSSVLKYSIDILRDINDNPEDVRVNPPPGKQDHEPVAEILGVGKNPFRLHLNEQQSQIYVANSRGGELSVFRIVDDAVVNRIALGAASGDVVQIADKAYVVTTTPFRGLPSRNASATPDDHEGDPVFLPGVDGANHQVHPGAQFDQTDSYNFEDLRNGVFVVNANLTGNPQYVTDDTEADDFFDEDQKQLAGAVPTAIIRNVAGNRVYIPMSASDLVQEFDIVGGDFRLQASGTVFNTRERPYAVALDEDNQQLLSVAWGGEVLELFDVASGDLIDSFDLGYAQPRYPATTMEAGEYFYQSAKWSNDGDKSCATCHYDELLTDGVGYANGATAATTYHQVKPNYNLMTTDQYFWNGTFQNNSYASLAFAAQARTNCELVLFSLVEGADSDPAQRVGDPVNFVANAAEDEQCRPDTQNVVDGLPNSLEGGTFADVIAPIIAAQKLRVADAVAASVQDQLLSAGLDPANGKDDVSRAMDYYGAAELRLPPNPVAQMRDLGMLASDVEQKLDQGENIFRNVANCDSCHDPENRRAPFTDGRAHGRGAGWIQQFINTYSQDPELLNIIPGGIPVQMLASLNASTTPQEINFHHNPLDFFEPFAFDENLVLKFEDPLTVRGQAVEDERLRRLTLINLADPDRGFVPGQVLGQARVDTPSLRAVWVQHNLLRHGLAFSIREAILPPGHAALEEGEKGWAVDTNRNFNVHGQTQNLTPAQVEALVLYLQSIE